MCRRLRSYMNDWLQSYKKTRAEQNKSIYFLRRVEVTYSKLRKKLVTNEQFSKINAESA